MRPAPRRRRSAASVYWVLRFNAQGPDGLLDRKPPGQPSKLNDGQRQVIARMVERGPISAVNGVVRWRLIDLAQWIFEEFRITIAKQTFHEWRDGRKRSPQFPSIHGPQLGGDGQAFQVTDPRGHAAAVKDAATKGHHAPTLRGDGQINTFVLIIKHGLAAPISIP